MYKNTKLAQSSRKHYKNILKAAFHGKSEEISSRLRWVLGSCQRPYNSDKTSQQKIVLHCAIMFFQKGPHMTINTFPYFSFPFLHAMCQLWNIFNILSKNSTFWLLAFGPDQISFIINDWKCIVHKQKTNFSYFIHILYSFFQFSIFNLPLHEYRE